MACQALAGEPVSLFATLVDRRRLRSAAAAAPEGSGVSLSELPRPSAPGGLLAAIQYVPLALASRASARGLVVDTDFWTFHPLALIELVVPHFFGDYFNSNLRELAWMLALNSQRDPFYYTMYVGVPIVLLAAVAVLSGRTGTRFWAITIAVCAVASLGAHTPIYPALQAILPFLKTFRFPVKYLSLAAFGFATLASMSFQWILDGDVPTRAVRRVLIGAGALAVITYVTIAWVLLAPAVPIRGFFELAVWAKVPAPIQGAEFLLYRARPLLTSLLLKMISTSFLLWVAASTRRERRLALAVFSAFAVIDLLASNSDVNPTTDPSLHQGTGVGRRSLPRDMHERVYVGGRLEGYVNTADDDAPKYASDTWTSTRSRNSATSSSANTCSSPPARACASRCPTICRCCGRSTSRARSRSSKSPRAKPGCVSCAVSACATSILPHPPYPGATPLARMEATIRCISTSSIRTRRG